MELVFILNNRFEYPTRKNKFNHLFKTNSKNIFLNAIQIIFLGLKMLPYTYIRHEFLTLNSTYLELYLNKNLCTIKNIISCPLTRKIRNDFCQDYFMEADS